MSMIRGHKLLPEEIKSKLPPIYTTQDQNDPVAQVKFFHALSQWTWYATEFDGTDQFYGLVVGFETELGYFSLAELESIGKDGRTLPIERDLYFKPTRLSEIK